MNHASILLLAAACSLSAGCASNHRTQGLPPPARAATVAIDLLAVIDLPRGKTSETVSATWFDEPSRTLYALKDNEPLLVPFLFGSDFRSATAGAPIPLTGQPEAPWDGEGLARKGDTFLVIADEMVPAIQRYDAQGKYLGRLELPAHFGDHQQTSGHKGLESLSVAPSGRFLFSANEAALKCDGPVANPEMGTLIRVWRHALEPGAADAERAYLTEPLGLGMGGDMGVSDVAALGDDKLLVLERGYQSKYGNTVRLFLADFDTGQDTLNVEAVTPATPRMQKKLLLDLASLPSAGVTHPSPQPNPILDNYEALSLGSVRPDGRRLLFVTSDDNARASQVPRILVFWLTVP
jgi:hypothetical protein